MPAQWSNPRTRSAAMQIAMFAIFVVMIGLAAWLSRSRWRAQGVTLDGAETVGGVRISLPAKWEVAREDYSDVEYLSSIEPQGKDAGRATRAIEAIVFPSRADPAEQLRRWIKDKYSRQNARNPDVLVSIDNLPDDPSAVHPSAFARVDSRRVIPGKGVLESRVLCACVRIGDRAVMLIVTDKARRPQTDEELLRNLARSVRLPASEAGSRPETGLARG